MKKKSLQPGDITCVIYHGNCPDGTGSAYIAWKYMTERYPNRTIKFYPMQIGGLPPTGLDGENVLICDYSFKKNVTDILLKKVNKLLIIDHHITSEKDLRDVDKKHKIFNTNYSGAMLTWFYFYPNIEPPLLIKYIQDRDLWTNTLPYIEYFASWFSSVPHNFMEYHKYTDDNLLREMIETKGAHYNELNEFYIRQSIDRVIPRFCEILGKYYLVGYLNSTILKSDIGNRIVERFPLIDFSVIYNINDHKNCTVFSLRSTEDRTDVSEIAIGFGGGGHKTSSGLKINNVTNRLPGNIFDSGEIYRSLENVYFRNILVEYKRYNICVVETQKFGFEVAKYLLQNKYCNKNSTHINNAENLHLKKNKFYSWTPVIVTKRWDHKISQYKYSVYFDISINDEEKKAIINEIGSKHHQRNADYKRNKKSFIYNSI